MAISVEIVRTIGSDKYVVYIDGKEKVKDLSFSEAVEWLKKAEDSSE